MNFGAIKPAPQRYTRTVVSIVGVAALAVTVGACGTATTNTGQSSTPTTASASPVTTAPAAADTITDQQRLQLCSDLEEQLQEWRIQGPTLGRGGLNIVVQTWAAQSGVINLRIVQDRSIVDEITVAQCPEVREEAMRSLDIPDLASGLVGF